MWADCATDLRFLGMGKEMSYDDARSLFRKGVREQKDAFGTNASPSATKKAQEWIAAWRRVEQLYQQKNTN